MASLVKPVTWMLGLVLLVVGVLGFFMDPVLVFEVNLNHNIVHILSGALALFAAKKGHDMSVLFLIVFGLVYGLVAVAGLMGVGFLVSLFDLNAHDNYLHVAIAAVCLIVGFGGKK